MHVNNTRGENVMGKPSIGMAITPVIGNETKNEVKMLTILKEDSKESIYNMIFLETDEGGIKNDE